MSVTDEQEVETSTGDEDVAEQMASRASKSGKKPKKAVKGATSAKEARAIAAKNKNKGQKGGVKKVGVIDTIFECLASENGASVEEILNKLVKKFPDRGREQMETTVRIQITRLPKRYAFALKKTKDEKRGMVYKAPVSALKQHQKGKASAEAAA